jgi:hypothetical protein
MRLWPEPATPWFDAMWACPWCFATTYVGSAQWEIERPIYMPADMRWEQAMAEGTRFSVAHAYGSFRRTLCGVERPDLYPTDYPWQPKSEGACDECWHTALTIDERWPPSMRGIEARISIKRPR